MKQLLRALVLSLVWLLTYSSSSAFEVVNSDGVSLYYRELTSTTCEVSGYSETLTYPYQITVPSTVTYNGRTYTVVAVGNLAFKEDNSGNGKIRSVTLPETITTIGIYAFSYCKKLTTINMPSSLTEIGESAFYGCESLEGIEIPESLEYLGGDAFRSCSALRVVNYNATNCTTNNNNPGWGDIFYKSYGTHVVSEVNIGNNVKILPKKIFAGVAITQIDIPSSVVTIDDYAFDSCYDLVNLTGMTNVESIGEGAFLYCGSLEVVNFGANLKSIGTNSFASCYSLNTVSDIPTTLSQIGDGPFRGCKNLMGFYGANTTPDHRCLIYGGELIGFAPRDLTKYDFPEGIESIGSQAVYGLNDLNEVSLPSTLRTISTSSFAYTSLTTVSLPEGLETINDRAFYGTSIWKIEIPTSVNRIGSNSFPNDVILIMQNDNPQELTINGIMSCESLYVPFGTTTKYQSVNAFANVKYIRELSMDLTDDYGYRGFDLYGDGWTCYKNVDLSNCHVTYSRNFSKTTWQALYVPYDMPYEDWVQYGEIARINNVHQFDTDDDGVIDETKIEFVKVKSGRLVPNTPYVFKPKEAGEITFVSEKCMLKAAPAENGYVDCSSTTTTYALTGVYSTTSGLFSKGAYTLFDGAFRPIGADDVTLSPFRFYMTITPREGFYNDPTQVSRPQRIRIYVDGKEQTTGLDNFIIQPFDNGLYYNLQGVPTANPTNGLYIKNGKKIFINH